MVTEITLPSAELRQLFPKNGFRLTNISLFSIAPPDHAQVTVQLLKKYYTAGELKTKTYVDGTSNVGGNIFPIVPLVKKIICVEIGNLTSKLLQHNLQTACTKKNLAKTLVLNKDFTKFNFKKYKPDIMFVDPPWGGKNYKKIKDKELYLSKKPMSKLLVNKWIPAVDLIILRVPAGYPTRRLINFQKIKYYTHVRLKTDYGRTIYKLLIFSKTPPISPIPSDIIVKSVNYKSFHPTEVKNDN